MPLNVQKVKWEQARSHTVTAAPTPAPGMQHGRGGQGGDAGFADWILTPAARILPLSTRAGLQAVLFDLDGVLVDTAEFHYRSWQQLADELGLPFDRRRNQSFRGVGRMECLDKLLGQHAPLFALEEKQLLADRKNSYYLALIQTLTPAHLLPGVRELIAALRQSGEGPAAIRLAVVSASRNARLVLDLLRIADWFDRVIDGNDVSRGKPDPQGFLLAAERLRVRPEQCVVIEDADAGIRAARAAGMKSIGIGDAATAADIPVAWSAGITPRMLESLIPSQN